jgi:hypothetical protein
MSDKRRRQYVPLTSQFGHDRFCVRIKEKFGRDGLLVWALYLAACKRATQQGEFDYVSEGDGWHRLGLLGLEPDFTLRTFFTYTGQLHATARRTSGDVTTIVCRSWHEWNTEFRRQQDASQKARKRAETTATPQRHPHDEPPTAGKTEGEYEVEQPLSTREGTTRRGPIRCCAPDQPCISLTFRNERELRDHLSNVHWLDDTQIETALRPRLTVIEGATA